MKKKKESNSKKGGRPKQNGGFSYKRDSRGRGGHMRRGRPERWGGEKSSYFPKVPRREGASEEGR